MPSIDLIISPNLNPARSAGESELILIMNAPPSSEVFNVHPKYGLFKLVSNPSKYLVGKILVLFLIELRVIPNNSPFLLTTGLPGKEEQLCN